MTTWQSARERIAAPESEKELVCIHCNRRKGEHPAPDEPGFGPAAECPGFEVAIGKRRPA